MFVEDFEEAKLAHLQKLAEEERFLLAQFDALAGIKELETLLEDDWIIKEWLKTAEASLATAQPKIVATGARSPLSDANSRPQLFVTPRQPVRSGVHFPRVERTTVVVPITVAASPQAPPPQAPPPQAPPPQAPLPQVLDNPQDPQAINSSSEYRTPETINRKRSKSPLRRTKTKLKMHEFRDKHVKKIDTRFTLSDEEF